MKEKKAVHIKINTHNIEDDASALTSSDIRISHCILLDIEHSYKSENNFVQDLFKRIADPSQFAINMHKTFYRYPGIDLSRDKMDVVKNKYDVRKVLNPDKADFRIIGEKTVTKLTSYRWSNSLSSVQFLSDALTKYKGAFTEGLLKDLTEIIDEFDPEYTVIFDTDRRYGAQYKNKDINNFIDALDNLKNESINIVHGMTNMETFKSLYDPNIIFVTDTYMNEITGEDSVALDDESYKSIHAMLKSGNKEDLTVGMTMMANCNVAKSKTYLGLLFFHFSDTLRGGPVWNQVAFKTLKKQFDKYVLENNHYHANRYSQCLQLLAEDGALTIEAAKHLINLVFKNVINGNTGINSENCVFKVSKASIKLTDEVKAKVKRGSNISKEYLIHHTDDLPF